MSKLFLVSFEILTECALNIFKNKGKYKDLVFIIVQLYTENTVVQSGGLPKPLS